MSTSTASHTYAAAGTYTIRLTVTDSLGATATSTQTVTVAPGVVTNAPPTAAFTIAPSGLSVSVDAIGSTDPDGTITAYAWTFGDGGTATTRTAAHTYASGGVKTVGLTVTDNKGATGTASHTVTLSPTTTNIPPIAAFTATGTSTGLPTFDGSTSTDSDGTVVSWAWTFGDGRTGSGQVVSHSYTSSGTYAVGLTVTDDKGATNTISKSVTVSVPSGGGGVPVWDHIVYVWLENQGYDTIMGSSSQTPYVRGLGLANALFNDMHGVAHPSQPNYLAAFAGSTMGVSDDANHDVSGPNLYTQMKAAGLSFKGYSELLPSPGYLLNSYPTGSDLGYRRKHAPYVSFQVSGNFDGAQHVPLTQLPTDFTQLPRLCYIIPTESNDMHTPEGTLAGGDAWMQQHVGPIIDWAMNPANKTLVVITFDEDDGQTINRMPMMMMGAYVKPGLYGGRINHYDVLGMMQDSLKLPRLRGSIGLPALTAPFAAPTGTPVNHPPTAAFTTTTSGATVVFNGGSSSDSDGTLTSYAWAFGDGVTGSGVSVSHTYTTTGTFPVTLTVTDNGSATASVTKSVSATAPTSTGGEPTGANIVGYETLAGSTFSARANSAGSTKLVAFPSGTFSFNNFGDGNQTVVQGESAYGALIHTAGLLGSGQTATVLQMTPNTSNKAAAVPPACGGGTSCPTNNLYLVAVTTAGMKVDGLTLQGTTQGHLYGGIVFASIANPILSNTTVKAIPGDSSANPGETFHVNFNRASGTATVKNVTIDGANIGAAGIATNSCAAHFVIDGLKTMNLAKSAGWASWQQTGVMDFRNFTSTNNARAFGAERLAAQVNFTDPVWTTPGVGHDITYTWEAGFVSGSINFYFSTAAAWTAFNANRTTKKIIILTNKAAGITSSVNVYVAGALQPQATYVTFQ